MMRIRLQTLNRMTPYLVWIRWYKISEDRGMLVKRIGDETIYRPFMDLCPDLKPFEFPAGGDPLRTG